MAKKKKLQLKVVDRGFATTSTPKKIESEEDIVLQRPEGGNQAAEVLGKTSDKLTSLDSQDSDSLNKDALRLFADKWQAKTIGEIDRLLKKQHFEANQTNALYNLRLDTDIVEEVVLQCRDDGPTRARETNTDDEVFDLLKLNIETEKQLQQLGVTFGVLCRLGFSLRRVEQCLSAIKGYDLDEAFEWMCGNCLENELGLSTSTESSVDGGAAELFGLESEGDRHTSSWATTHLSSEERMIIPGCESQGHPPVATQLSKALNGTSQALDHEDSLFGDSLQSLLTEPASGEISSEGKTIRVYDLFQPKAWFGPTPKLILSSFVSNMDPKATIRYQALGSSHRFQRALLEVVWSTGQIKTWSMTEQVACSDILQAEQFIATASLHNLMFRSTFVFGDLLPETKRVLSQIRSLPPVYRELFEEYESSRQLELTEANLDIWERLYRCLLSRPRIPDGQNITKPSSESYILQQNDFISDIQTRSKETTEPTEKITKPRLFRSEGDKLPIAAYREQIISVVGSSQVVVLSGETGCGKSTQVPAYLYEAGLLAGQSVKVLCTEPRRISAISLARRVSAEFAEPPSALGTTSSIVGYAIRLENKTCKTTRIVYATTGVALRMLETTREGTGSASFDEITHVVVDEVHERSIDSDFLLIILKELCVQKPKLKVILMSATVDAQKFSQYFGACPMLFIPGRTYPVKGVFLEEATELCCSSSMPGVGKLGLTYSVHEDRIQEPLRSAGREMTTESLDEYDIPYDLIINLIDADLSKSVVCTICC